MVFDVNIDVLFETSSELNVSWTVLVVDISGDVKVLL